MQLEYERCGDYVIATMRGQASEFADLLTALKKNRPDKTGQVGSPVGEFIHKVILSTLEEEGKEATP